MINVLYDISPLGHCYGESINKTGIARVVETLAYQLAERPDCHLELCSNEFLPGALDYAGSDLRLKTVNFSHNKPSVSFQRLQQDTQRVIDTASGPARALARAKRKLLHYASKVDKAHTQPLDPSSLRTADIYHSVYRAVPEQARAAKGPRLFLTVHDMIPKLLPQHCNAYVQTLFDDILSSIKEDTWLLSVSESTKADFCNHLKIDPARVFVTPLAADPLLFHPVTNADELTRVQNKYHVKPASYVLSLCTFEAHKNLDHAIRCYVRLMQSGQTPDLQLVLAGSREGSRDRIFREIAEAEAFKDNIVVTGFVANEDLAALYSGALAFVYPSLYEGFGLPPLEAMQCGVPVITSNTSSLPEVVGDAGIMLDPKDADGLCGVLLSLYEDADLRAALSVKSLARASQFSWKRCAEDTVNAYKTALGR